jgi:uncharacterized membrane protein YidH (DUF202 family)
MLAFGAVLTVVGLAIAGTAPVVGIGSEEHVRTRQSAGGVLVVVGWLLLGWAIHRLGRERRQ